MNTKIIFFVLCTLLLSCSVSPVFVNENGKNWDLWESIDVPQKVNLACELRPLDEHQKNVMFKYDIQVTGNRLPNLKLNSFFIVSENGDTIPIKIQCFFNKQVANYDCTIPLFCKSYNGRKGQLMISVLFSLNKPIKPIYIYYDMDVGTRHFIVKSRYKKRVNVDIRGF